MRPFFVSFRRSSSKAFQVESSYMTNPLKKFLTKKENYDII